MDNYFLIKILNEIQEKEDYISERNIKEISKKYQIPVSRIYSVISFHSFLKSKKQGENIIELCGSPSCVLNKSRELEKFLEDYLKIKIGHTTKDKKFSVYKTSCIGCCNEAPAALINGIPYTKLTIKRLKKILRSLKNANIKRN